MKFIFMLAMLAFAASVQAGTILKYQMGSGFEPNPSERTVLVDDNGDVTSYRKYFRTNQTDIQKVAELSKPAILKIKSLIRGVPAKSEVKDSDPSAPECSDFPPVNITIPKSGRELTIFKADSCHEFTLEDHSADKLVEIAKAFFNLRYEGEETGSNSASKLIEYAVGMSLDPHIRFVSASANGNMISIVQNPAARTPPVKVNLGRLSETAVSALRYLIKNVEEKELTDPSPESPKCSDYPPISTSIWQDEKEIQIFRAASCHRYIRTDWIAEALDGIAKALNDLADF